MPTQRDIIQRLAVPKYAPRINPTPIPEAAWNDAPLFCLQVNVEWVAHIIGAMNVLDQDDTWIGNDDERYAARQQVNEIIASLMEGCDDMSGCCPEPLQRMTEDGILQVSYDGGATWVNADQQDDPRQRIAQLPPLTGDDGNDKRCIAANDVLGQFRDGIQTFEGYFDTTATVVEFVTAVGAAIAGLLVLPLAAPIIVAAVFTLMAALYHLGKENYVAAFTDTVYGDLLCILYRNCATDGTFSQEGLDTIRAAIASHFDSTAGGAFLALLNGVQLAGLNNMAKINAGSFASCDLCEGTAEVWALTAEGTYTQRFPSLGGVFTVTGEFVGTGGYYYSEIVFNDGFSNSSDDLCNNITVIDDGGKDNYGVTLRCSDGADDALSNCNRLIQFRKTGAPFTFTFTLNNPDPCD